MSDETKKNKNDPNEPSVVSGVVSEYRAEFKRIVWPSREVLIKHTVTVVAVSLIFGAYIALMDGTFGFILQRFISLVLG